MSMKYYQRRRREFPYLAVTNRKVKPDEFVDLCPWVTFCCTPVADELYYWMFSRAVDLYFFHQFRVWRRS